MNVFVKEYTDCLKQVFANFTGEEVNKEYDAALAQMQKKASFPGYRQGKVPFDIIEKNSSDELMRVIVNGLVLKAAEKLQGDGVRIYSEPRFKPLSSLTRNTAFSFSMVFDGYPKVVKNVDIGSAVVDFDEYYYDDKMMDQSLRRDFKNLEEVSGKIEDGDTVTVKAAGDAEEKTLDSHVVTKLNGRKAGDRIALDFAELDTYVVDFLGKAGNSVELEIVKVERSREQDVTDELIQQVSAFKTVEEYKKSTKVRFDNMEKDFNAMSKRNALMEHFSKNAVVEYPKSEFIRESRRELNEFINSNFSVSEIGLTSLIQDKKLKDEFNVLPEKIHKNIVFFLSVMDIADKNKIQPGKESIDRIARSHAREHDLSLEEYKERADQEEWNSVLERAKFDAALNFLMEKMKFQAKGKVPLVK